MKKFLKWLMPVDDHEADRAIDVLQSMSWAELINGTLIITMGLITIPLLILLWDVRGAIA